MIEIFRQATLQQFEAALGTLKHCADHCPDEMWEQRVCNHTFNQSIFHTLFFTDVYLGPDLASVREQTFHHQNLDAFRDYEELEDRQPECSYSRDFIERYFAHCHRKSEDAIAGETEHSLAQPCQFEWLDVKRIEVYPYTIRHIQHHAAQLILKMRIDQIWNANWVKSGWPFDMGDDS